MEVEKITKFDRDTLSELKARMQGALNNVGEEYGVDIRVGPGSYRSKNATIKLEISTVVDGEVQSKEAQDFKRLAVTYGLKPEDLGRKFYDMQDRECSIEGLLIRRRKYPILCKTTKTGQQFIVTAGYVKRCLVEFEED